MQWQNYIERNPDILLGKPVIKGTRIGVELIMRKLAGGYSFNDLLNAYPHLTQEQIAAACEVLSIKPNNLYTIFAKAERVQTTTLRRLYTLCSPD
jgi:uncharacterized protein (DUF433 family)